MILKTLFYAILIYFAIRIGQRIFTVRKAVKEMRSRMEDYARDQQFGDSRQEGDVIIKNTGKKRDQKYEAGDYVDYEEID